jgi:DEAD/DEAH box helicase domain-containing protein
MVQCSQCRTTGWLSRLVQGSNKLSTKLDEIYNTWFSRRPEAARLYAAKSLGRPHVEGVNISTPAWPAAMCSTARGPVWPAPPGAATGVPGDGAAQHVVGNAQYTRHDDTCPSCGERDELLLLGARNATLGSQVVEPAGPACSTTTRS